MHGALISPHRMRTRCKYLAHQTVLRAQVAPAGGAPPEPREAHCACILSRFLLVAGGVQQGDGAAPRVLGDLHVRARARADGRLRTPPAAGQRPAAVDRPGDCAQIAWRSVCADGRVGLGWHCPRRCDSPPARRCWTRARPRGSAWRRATGPRLPSPAVALARAARSAARACSRCAWAGMAASANCRRALRGFRRGLGPACVPLLASEHRRCRAAGRASARCARFWRVPHALCMRKHDECLSKFRWQEHAGRAAVTPACSQQSRPGPRACTTDIAAGAGEGAGTRRWALPVRRHMQTADRWP